MTKPKHWPTKKIEEVLSENYTRGSTGKDFEYYKEDLQSELWGRDLKTQEITLKKRERESIEELNYVPF